MKTLREYIDEVVSETQINENRVDEARTVKILSSGEKDRRAIYDLKKKLDALDALTSFEYNGKRNNDSAYATLSVNDPDILKETADAVNEERGVKLEIL